MWFTLFAEHCPVASLPICLNEILRLRMTLIQVGILILKTRQSNRWQEQGTKLSLCQKWKHTREVYQILNETRCGSLDLRKIPIVIIMQRLWKSLKSVLSSRTLYCCLSWFEVGMKRWILQIISTNVLFWQADDDVIDGVRRFRFGSRKSRKDNRKDESPTSGNGRAMFLSENCNRQLWFTSAEPAISDHEIFIK